MATYSIRNSRAAFSVIEVLTAIIVAAIGVAGIMLMIPFAVGQAEQGLDQQIASNLARNASEEMKIRRFFDPLAWQPLPGGQTGTSRDYLLDPAGVSARQLAGEGPGVFPFVSVQLETAVTASSSQSYYQDGTQSFDKTILINRRNLNSFATTDKQRQELARTLFQWNDDLVFSTELKGNGGMSPDLLPPQQIMDVVPGTSIPLRRQAEGEMSYVVVSSPVNLTPEPSSYPTTPLNPDNGILDRTESFRNQVLSYQRRLPPLLTSLNFDRVYCVFPPTVNAAGEFAPADRIAFTGGDFFLTDEIDSNLRSSNAGSTQRKEIRRGDWIELVNVNFDLNVNRFRRQIQFYQVLDAWYDSTNPPFGWHVTLQGPNFDFGLAKTGSIPDNPQIYGTGFGTGFPDYAAHVRSVSGQTRTIPSKTYAIHLPDVWAVIERTSSIPTLR